MSLLANGDLGWIHVTNLVVRLPDRGLLRARPALRGRGPLRCAAYSRTTGALFLAGFVAMSAGAGNTVGNLAFTAAILLVWAWLSALSVHLRKRVPNA
ncbi:hypothetical protein [Actinomadura sp. 6N118]|uniref:hypothetical protein n=1 Tax=Actinomadura sp. 6N118 TaxID=3375151 RepID=UPI0037B48671